MSIVWACPLDVEAYIKHGRGIETPRPACPLCAGTTGSWSGYERHLRDERDRLIWIPRVRCGACGVTQALLPWFVVAWRWDVVEVIGRALELAAEGWGHRRIARSVGRPETTVRDWCRRFRGRAALVASVLLGRAVSWGWSGWELPTAPLQRCRAAVEAVAGQWQRRRGPVERWRLVNLITGGRLLATNTSPLLAAGPVWSSMSASPSRRCRMAPDPAEELSLWRYHLIAEALDRRIGSRERGLVVRRIASEEHLGADGQTQAVSRNTLDRWIRAYRQQGLAGLRDRPRSDQGSVRRHAELIQEAVQLRLEQPARSAAHIAEILSARHGVRVAERTLREKFQKRGLARAELLRDQRTFGRYEAAEPNERWIADVLVGPWVPHPKAPGSQKARLFLIVDDHSRLVVHGRWVGNETLRAGQEVLHTAIRDRILSGSSRSTFRNSRERAAHRRTPLVARVDEPQVFRQAIRVEARRLGVRVRTGTAAQDPQVVWACDPNWELSEEEYARQSRRVNGHVSTDTPCGESVGRSPESM